MWWNNALVVDPGWLVGRSVGWLVQKGRKWQVSGYAVRFYVMSAADSDDHDDTDHSDVDPVAMIQSAREVALLTHLGIGAVWTTVECRLQMHSIGCNPPAK